MTVLKVRWRVREGVRLRPERLRWPPGTQGRCVVVIIFLVATIMHGGVGAVQRSRAGYVHRRDVFSRRREDVVRIRLTLVVLFLATCAGVG